MILITACDDDYLKYAVPMVKSFLKFNSTLRGEGQAVIYRMNPKKKLADFEGCFFSTFDASNIKPKQSKAATAANARVFILASLMEQLPDEQQILYLDADSVVRGKVPECRGDISALHRPMEQREELEYLISTIRLKVNYSSRQFCRNWERITQQMISDGKDSIMTCQQSYARAVKATRDLIHEPASKSLSDWDFADDSLVWCAKGPRKENPSFEAELKKYG